MPKPLRHHKKSGVITPKGSEKPATQQLNELYQAFLDDGTHFHFPGNGRVFVNGTQLPSCLKERFYDALEEHLRDFFVLHRGGKRNGQGNK